MAVNQAYDHIKHQKSERAHPLGQGLISQNPDSNKKETFKFVFGGKKKE
jgi:hypothetical protein